MIGYRLNAFILLGFLVFYLYDAGLVYYKLLFPVAITYRYVEYRKKQWQQYLIEFCYFGNLLLYNTSLQHICYVIAHGPLIIAACYLKDSFDLNNTQKMISWMIHVAPAILTSIYVTPDASIGIMELIIESLKMYSMWWLVYTCNLLSSNCTNMYTYTIQQNPSLAAFLNKTKYKKVIFMLCHYLAMTIFIIIGALCYHYQYLHDLLLLAIVVNTFYNI